VNPEFERNLWLEASSRRIIGVAVVLGLIYGATALVTKGDLHALSQALSVVGALVFAACGLIWASRAAGSSVLDEIRGRTWDFQRLSALTPWAMTWGKLFGASSLAWAAGLTGLAAACIGLEGADIPGKQTYVLNLILAAVGLAVFLQGCAMGAALVGVRKARAEGRMASGGAVLLGVILGFLLLSMFGSKLPFAAGAWSGGVPLGLALNQQIVWWGHPLPQITFTSLSLCVFAAWSLTGAWRLMRLELQLRNSQWIWAAFLLFAAIWRAGLAPAAGGASAALLTAALVFAAAAYVAAFVEPADAVRLRQFAAAVRAWSIPRMIELAPAGAGAAKLAFLSVIGFCLVSAAAPSGDPTVPTPVAALAAIAFMARDLGVIVFFRFGPRPGRGDLTAVIALVLLYWVGGLIGAVAGGPTGAALFSPLAQGAPLVSLASGAVQAVVAWWLAVGRLRRPAGA
jgi:hypothetical protein